MTPANAAVTAMNDAKFALNSGHISYTIWNG